MWFSNLETMEEILSGYFFTAKEFTEEDGTVTLSLNEIDLIENEETEEKAREALGTSILEYAMEFYEHYELYSKSANRKKHIPYIFKALIMDDAKMIGECIECRVGEN
jgi:hypothetical protein